mgnify:CR=1 FL=1
MMDKWVATIERGEDIDNRVKTVEELLPENYSELLLDYNDIRNNNLNSKMEILKKLDKYSEEEKNNIADILTVATIKYTDLLPFRTTDYIFDVEGISNDINQAYLYVKQCNSLMDEIETYEGDARDEMYLFFRSLSSHVQKMMTLYKTAQVYLSNTYTTSYYTEKQLVDWIINKIGEK